MALVTGCTIHDDPAEFSTGFTVKVGLIDNVLNIFNTLDARLHQPSGLDHSRFLIGALFSGALTYNAVLTAAMALIDSTILEVWT